MVRHYFNHLGVAVLSLTSELRIKDIIHIAGHTTDICQENFSMEINHHQVKTGRPGEEVAIKVIGLARAGDKVYLAPQAIPMTLDEVQERWADEREW